MTKYLQGAAKRLTLSLIVLSALGGCAVYGPVPAGAYGYYGADPYGPATSAAPPVYSTPYSYYSPYYTPYYGPTYIGSPLSLNFGFGFRGGHRDGYRGYGGYRGGHR